MKKRKILLDVEPRFGHTSHVVADTLILVGGVTPYGPSGLSVFLFNYQLNTYLTLKRYSAKAYKQMTILINPPIFYTKNMV